jgi:hypothetical protein
VGHPVHKTTIYRLLDRHQWRSYCTKTLPPGIRPVVPKQQVREYVYAYAAVAPQLGRMTALILPYANTQMMNLFLMLSIALRLASASASTLALWLRG